VSGPARYRLTEAADADVLAILAESARLFGPAQRDRYAALVETAARMVAEDPGRPGSRDRSDLPEGVRSFHVELAARRRGAAAHVLYYVRERSPDGGEVVIIARVLHERMEPALHVVGGLD
jgi:toxin ParE1/3/4